METSDNFLGIDDFKLSEFTKVLPVTVFLVSDDEGSTGVFFHLFVLGKERLIDHFTDVLEGVVDDSCNTAQVRSDEVVLFTVL